MEPLTLFQTLAIAAFGALLVLTLMSVSRGRITGRAGVLWTALWVTSILTVLYPRVTKDLAYVLGISRGVDVILYSALFAGLAGFFAIYVRFRRLERQITVLTRELAIQESSRSSSRPASDTASHPIEGEPER